MHIDPWIFSFSALTVIATVWMGFWSAKRSKTAHDFFVAGRNVSVGWNASAISGEYLSAASFMGVAGMVMSSGYDALWYPVCYACGYLFLLLFIAGPLRRFGAYTIPDFAEGRYDSPVFRKIAVVFVLFIGFFYTMPQMKGAGTTLAYIFQDVDLRGMLPGFLLSHDAEGLPAKGLPYWAGVVLVGAVITLNVALGGMKGITLVQAFQYWAKMFAISVPIFVLMAVYGHYGRQVGVNGENIEHPTSNIQHRTNAVTPQLDVRSSMLGVGRLPLPDKAPKDETWLNPFGPLTTKAAKAAAQALPVEPVIEKISLKNGQGDPVGPMTFQNAPIETALDFYGVIVGRELLPRRITRMPGESVPDKNLVQKLNRVLKGQLTRAGLLRPLPPIRGGAVSIAGPRTQAELKAQLESAIEAAGVTLVPVGENYFRAIETAKLDEYKDSLRSETRDAWLSTHERPLGLLYTYSLIIALVCGTAGLPHILVRFYTNPDGVAAKRTTMWVMILIGVFYLFPPVFGVMGRNLLPDLYAASGAKGTDKVVLELPRILNSMPNAKSSMLNAQSTTNSSSIEQRASDIEHRKGIPWGSILSGITCAGAFAAFMSTFSGLLVSMTGALAHDVYGRIFRPRSTPQQRLIAFKISAVLIGAIAILLGMQVEQLQINFMVGQAFAIAAASYFPLLFMSCWWRGMTVKGAATGMLTGGLCALVAVTLTNFSDLKWIDLANFWAAHPLARILCEQPAIWTVPLAIGLMVIVSKLTRHQLPPDIRMKMLVLHAPEQLGLKQEYIQEHVAH